MVPVVKLELVETSTAYDVAPSTALQLASNARHNIPRAEPTVGAGSEGGHEIVPSTAGSASTASDASSPRTTDVSAAIAASIAPSAAVEPSTVVPSTTTVVSVEV